MTMRFFSHEWAALDPEDAATVPDNYNQLLENISAPLGFVIREFVAAEDLRGALLDDLIKPGKGDTLSLCLISGDQAHGYYKLLIEYTGAEVLTPLLSVRRALESRRVRVRYDEFAVDVDTFAHNLLFWPKEFGTLEISFSSLSFSRTRLPGRQYVSYGALGENLGKD